MSLKSKVVIIMLGIFLILGGVNFCIQRFILLPGFLSLEEQEAIQDADRVLQAINREIQFLDGIAHDWAAWDDTYAFVKSPSDDFIESNFSSAVFKDAHLNLVYIYNKDRNLVWRGAHHLDKAVETALAAQFPDHLSDTHPLISYRLENTPLVNVYISGVFSTPEGPMIIGSRPIIRSSNEGPIRGYLILGYLIDDGLIEKISHQTSIDLKGIPVQKALAFDTPEDFTHLLSGELPYLIEAGKDMPILKIYKTLRDIEGNTALIIRADLPRNIMAKGYTTVCVAAVSFLITMVTALSVLLFLMQRAVLKPISKLTAYVVASKSEHTLQRQLPIKRQDEIGILGREFDSMLNRLRNRSLRMEELNTRLLEDIGKQKQAQEALRSSEEKLARSRKMESLGLLAGGVAHDLNNVLSGIVSYPELILMDLPEDSKLIKPLETMHTSGKRAVAIVQDLLTVARGVAVERHPLNMNHVVGRYLESAEHQKLLQYHPGVVVKTELAPQLLSINGASVHIGKTLMNLVSNAAEVLEDGGEIIIRTENRYLDQPLKGYEDVNAGEYAVLTVADNGSGISPLDLERIFEPFYTKKVMGRSGTGLGLTIVWNVVQEHNGYINVSTDENGTAFELYLPITREELFKKDVSISIKDYSGKGEKILVVDDVDSQREIFCNMLEILGYHGKAVTSGEEAVTYLKENTVDLVILDMIMDPGMNGREAYERIIKLHPGQKAIIVSGFAETDDVREAQRLGAGRLVKKPVGLEKIGLAIKETLGK